MTIKITKGAHEKMFALIPAITLDWIDIYLEDKTVNVTFEFFKWYLSVEFYKDSK